MEKNRLELFHKLLGRSLGQAQIDFTDKLLYVTAAAPSLFCFIPAMDRLAELLEGYPEYFVGLDIPHPQQIRDWSSSAREAVGTWRGWDSELGFYVNLNGVEASKGRDGPQHPLLNYGAWTWGSYSILLVTKEATDPNAEGFDRTCAAVLAVALMYNLAVSPDVYMSCALEGKSPLESSITRRLVDAAFGLFRLQQLEPELDNKFNALASRHNSPYDIKHLLSSWADELSGCRNIGSADGLEANTDVREHIDTASELKKIVRLLDQAPVIKRESFEIATSDESLNDDAPVSRTARQKSIDLDSLKPLASLLISSRSLTYLPSVPIELQEIDEDILPDLLSNPSSDELRLAEDYDLAVEEVLEVLPFDVECLDFLEQEQDEPTLIATTINAADFKRRIAERQPTSVSYVGLDARIEFAEFLKRRMLEPNASGLAAILVASSWLTGRKIYHLSNQVWAASSEHINVEDFSETHSIFFDLKNPSMWVKLNRPCSHPINADDARQTKNWLKLPDVLDICKALTNNQVGSVTGDELGTALAKLLCDLKLELNITRAQIQNMLPEMLIWREGHGCTAALITDIGDLSLKINLHYLSPNSRFVAQSYIDAACEMLGLDETSEIANPYSSTSDEFVGMHMCPRVDALQSAIQQLYRFKGGPGDWQKAHNQITLATVMLLAFAVGARDALAYNPNAFDVINNQGVCHYLEKGEMRVIFLPKLVLDQLRIYNMHLAVIQKVWVAETGSAVPHKDLFFLFDSNGRPTTFHPKSFHVYLTQYGVEYKTPLNGLRRLIFTHLYESAECGVMLDVFIGHATDGRRPWSELSGMRLGSISNISSYINKFLYTVGWPTFMGCSHVPA